MSPVNDTFPVMLSMLNSFRVSFSENTILLFGLVLSASDALTVVMTCGGFTSSLTLVGVNDESNTGALSLASET